MCGGGLGHGAGVERPLIVVGLLYQRTVEVNWIYSLR
jgi:hypothetical protein